MGNLIVAIKPDIISNCLNSCGDCGNAKTAFMGSTRYQVVTCTFRRGTRQNGGFHIHETLFIEEPAQIAGDFGRNRSRFWHFRPTQIHISITQAVSFPTSTYSSSGNWRRFGTRQNLEVLAQHPDLARCHILVFGTGGAQNVLARSGVTTNSLRFSAALGTIRGIRIKHNLRDTFAIPQIQKDDAPVIPTTVNPSAKCNFPDLF